MPENINISIAGGLPEVYLTAFQLLRYLKESNNLFTNSNVLVHGGASGVGTTLIQMLSKIYKAKVIALCGKEEKIETLKS